ncbi:MAG: transglutaminase-like domain-containing protein [Dysgonamonadaceae bacterium]
MRTLLFILSLFLIAGCSVSEKNRIENEIAKGNFSAANKQIDLLLTDNKLTDDQRFLLKVKKDSIHRVSLDFNKTQGDIIDWIEENLLFTPSADQISSWESDGSLEFRLIDGEKRYFRNAATNIFRVNDEAKKLAPSLTTSYRKTDSIIDADLAKMLPTTIKGHYLLPKKQMNVLYTVTVNANAVSEGEIVRAWLPYPRKDIHRQTDVQLIKTSQLDYILSDDKTAHTSIYMEKRAEKDKPTVFQVEFEFSSQGEWFDLSQIDINSYDKSSPDYKYYTSEKKPHIQFSNRLKSLTDSITKDATDPIETLQSIYRYIAANYPWASALGYSIIPNIPTYVIENRKGDCGQVTLLLINMLRYKGIPSRWQSGWMMHPGEVNLHDWAEVYFEGVGWIPVDMSFGRGEELKHPIGREFFMSGIDSYRFYVNSDFSDAFIPEKKFPRSDTVDFQCGEVELESWNLYYDLWHYSMDYIIELSDGEYYMKGQNKFTSFEGKALSRPATF